MANPLLEPISQWIGSPARKRNLSIALVLVLSLFGFGSLIYWNSKPEYQVLFSNLSTEDAGEMVNKLKEKRIPFQLSSNGTSILVAREQVYDTRLALAAEGLPKGGGVGFEVFDRSNLGATDFVQKLNYQRALQGELSRTIRQIKEVEQARVHIVTPKESLFLEDQKKPSASVLIKTRSGMKLDPGQVEGIVHLVASAVEGLDSGNITVVDTSGKVLFKRNESTLLGQMTTHQLDYQRNIEENLRKKAQGMLEEVLGFNKAIARVSADIDFQQVDITEERFDPNSVVRSEQKNTEKSSQVSNARTAAGAKPETLPPAKALEEKAKTVPEAKARTVEPIPLQSNQSERQNEVRNYEISRVNKRIKSPVGIVKKISAAVIVDGTYKEVADAKGKKGREYQARSPEEMKSLEAMVKKAIGFDEARGDQVEVINMPFTWSVAEEDSKPAAAEGWKEYILISYKPLVSLVLAVLFIFFVVRPLLRRRGPLPQDETSYLPKPSLHPALPPDSSPQAKPLDLKSQTVQLIQENPSRAVGIIKEWISEGKDA
ncbi:MAG: flagellar M-ring protein FliF [Syntrophaceae bacterium]|nr:flagellar M-ring protein FliF [Syntrophaceae bacterium]